MNDFLKRLQAEELAIANGDYRESPAQGAVKDLNSLSDEGQEITFNLFGGEVTIKASSPRQQEINRRLREKDKEDEIKRRKESLRRRAFTDVYDYGFAGFRIDKENRSYYDIAISYVRHFKENRDDNIGMIFYGLPGTGKSHLAFSIANNLLEYGYKVIVLSQTGLMQEIKRVSKFGTQGEVEFFDEIGRCDLLILDDLGVGGRSDWELSQLYKAIDDRYRAKLPTIVTTNLDMEKLCKYLSYDGVDRTFDRLMEMCPIPVEFKNRPRRLQTAEDKREKFMRRMHDEINGY
ncbi:ATP-binding protein [Aedoeadaptatus coxii]|uniref:ATP-binding protein n=1 Tax=Aedoeadaptatus coxii TaxID=755172 RepID=UPI002AD41D6D|nr:ATP-binding protein [Peptoniphilus coxii]